MSYERIYVEVGSQAWLDARRQGVAASEIAGLLGIAPDSWSSPFNLYWSKKAGIGAEPDNELMQWGHELEAVILRRFAREHPELGVASGALYRRTDRPWQMATPDGLAYDDGPDLVAVVQAKTATKRDGWGEPGTDEIPPYYLAQVRYEMDVTGVRLAYVPVLFGVHDYREYVVHQDDQDVELMRKEAEDFLARVEYGIPPDVDHRAATLRTLRELHPTVEDAEADLDAAWIGEYRQARDAMAAAERRKKKAEAHIREQLGAAAYGVVDGDRACTRSVYDMPERTVKASTVDRLNVKKTKEDQ